MVDFQTYQSLVRLYADYAAVLDAGQWQQWPEFFADDCIYRIVPRENHERGFPLATLAFESKAMLQDRVYAISETIFHDPYYQRHVIGAPRIQSADGGQIESEASYAVFRTKPSQPTTVFKDRKSTRLNSSH